MNVLLQFAGFLCALYRPKQKPPSCDGGFVLVDTEGARLKIGRRDGRLRKLRQSGGKDECAIAVCRVLVRAVSAKTKTTILRWWFCFGGHRGTRTRDLTDVNRAL